MTDMFNCLYDDYLLECNDFKTALFIQECEVFELVDFLIKELDRLRILVLDARERAGYFAGKVKCLNTPYPIPGEDIWDCSFDEHPAMLRYHLLYNEVDINEEF